MVIDRFEDLKNLHMDYELIILIDQA